MEGIENRPTIESPEQTPEFHFQEIAEIEPAVVSLFGQLKEKIDREEYDTLISDDVGGRIPTLLFRKIIKQLHPDQNIETFFIASGKSYLPDPTEDEKFGVLLDYLKKVTRHSKKALVVTQYIHSGDTLENLSYALQSSGLDNFDMAAVDAMPGVFKNKSSRNTLGGVGLYVGSDDGHKLHENHDHLGGVRKTKTAYSPFPKRMVDVIAAEGRELTQEEWAEIFGIEKGDLSQAIKKKTDDPERKAEFERRRVAPLTTAETQKIQKNINLARADVTLLANRVIEQVWGKVE